MNTSTNSFRRAVIAGAVALTLGLTACGSDSNGTASDSTAASDATGITITDAWSREPADGQTTSAIYGVVTNNTDETVTLIAVTTPVTDDAQLHETLVADDGTMSMKERDGGFEIPAGGSMTFEPGGAHVMLMGIDDYPSIVDATFEFDNGEKITVDAHVRAIGADMEMDTDHDMDGDMDSSMPMSTDG